MRSWALLKGQQAAVGVSRALTQQRLAVLLLLICWWWRSAPCDAIPNGVLDTLGSLQQSQQCLGCCPPHCLPGILEECTQQPVQHTVPPRTAAQMADVTMLQASCCATQNLRGCRPRCCDPAAAWLLYPHAASQSAGQHWNNHCQHQAHLHQSFRPATALPPWPEVST